MRLKNPKEKHHYVRPVGEDRFADCHNPETRTKVSHKILSFGLAKILPELVQGLDWQYTRYIVRKSLKVALI